MTNEMSKNDRDNLLRIAKMRERVTKSGLVEAGAQLLVDLDKQLDAHYSFDSDEIWKEAVQAADQSVKEAQARVIERSRALGIPERFAPSIHMGWVQHGEQAVKERRNELRQMARQQVDAMIKSGKRKIEESSCDTQTRIIASGLSSQAKAFRETMPTATQLMPQLDLGELEKMLGKGAGYYQQRLEDE